MDLDASFVIDRYLSQQKNIFTVDEFNKYLRKNNVKLTKEQAFDILSSSGYVFSLINEEFVTRSAVFVGRWFSFMPSKEEIKKGYVILGHRCMPFINPEVAPDKITVVKADGNPVLPEAVSFTMNQAMDTFSLFGEGYVIPYIYSDHSNEKVTLASVQYGLPQYIDLTAWPLSKICGNKKIKYGDRILCRVIDWETSEVELTLQPAQRGDFLSEEDIAREEWYSTFEKTLLASFNKNGPASSIEEQLALLFLENLNVLCLKSCGSIEEFFKHTKKIGFASYGVESRLWKSNEVIPFIGPWNKQFKENTLMADISMIFSPQVFDAYLENYIYENLEVEKPEPLESLMDDIFPSALNMKPAERKLLLLNMEKRFGILKKNYNQFSDYKIAPVRARITKLCSEISSLVCSIGCSSLNLEDFPQQELVILVQLFSHIVKIIEEMENVFMKDHFPVEDVSLSLEGMEDTYEEISGKLKRSLYENTYKNITIM
ncbi:MAG: hypothetical protein MJ162_02375 [Treponema sp.]|nr:hypothetical protein [Treponema sp.]